MHTESDQFTHMRGIAPYLGGKSRLAKVIVEKIEQIPHLQYAEPFVGMGGVFFRRTKPARFEVINDISREVSTLYRVLQRHYQPFLDFMSWQLCSRDLFKLLRASNPYTLTDIERAARFYYLQKVGFGGKPTGQTYPAMSLDRSHFNVRRLAIELELINERLSGVIIECMDYQKFILRYDNEKTLFYLDPPYFNHETDYGKGVFHRDDFARLAELLGGIKGKFILSLNDVPEVRAIFASFTIMAVATKYTAQGGKAKDVGEVLITNAW